MNDRSDSADRVAADDPERANVLEETVKLSPETARAVAQNESVTGMRKPGPSEVDEARAAQARATEPHASGTPDP